MLENIKGIVTTLLSKLAIHKYGSITGYNPNNYTAKVDIMPEGTSTNWISLDCLGVGNGMGIVYGPSIGDQVALGFMEGSPQSAYIVRRMFNQSVSPPIVQSGQIAIYDKAGSFIRLNGDGTITIQAAQAANGTITMDAQTLVLNANLQQTGNQTVTGGITTTGDVVAAGISLDNHVHGNVQSGGSLTGGPQG